MQKIWTAAIIFAGALAAGAGAASAQTTTGMPPGSQNNNNGFPPRQSPLGQSSANEPDPAKAQLEAQRQRAAANERQKKLEADTEHLLHLAEELKQDVAKTSKNEMSLDVIRKAEEIEKLAHDVKQRMKG